jgi:hypothetical protein
MVVCFRSGFGSYALATGGQHPQAPWIDGIPLVVFCFLFAFILFWFARTTAVGAPWTPPSHRTSHIDQPAGLTSSAAGPASRKITPIPARFIVEAAILTAMSAGLIVWPIVMLVQPSHAGTGPSQGTLENTIAEGVFGLLGTGFMFWLIGKRLSERKSQLAELRADTLPDRAKRAAQVLQQAVTLFGELQAELDTRAALLTHAKQQLAETTQQAADMQRLAAEDPEILCIVNEGWDRALERRFGTFERGARRREWLIGTVVAIAVGVIAILLSHFLFGF